MGLIANPSRATLGAERRTQAGEPRKKRDNVHRVRQKIWTIAHWTVEGHYYKSVRLENAYQGVKRNDRYHRSSFSVCSPKDKDQAPRIRSSAVYCGSHYCTAAEVGDRRRTLLWRTLGGGWRRWHRTPAASRWARHSAVTEPAGSRLTNPFICSWKNTCLRHFFSMPYGHDSVVDSNVFVWVGRFVRWDGCAPRYREQQSTCRLRFHRGRLNIGVIFLANWLFQDYISVVESFFTIDLARRLRR